MNVVNGEISLIGPRPETPELVREYSNQIAFYGIRHTVTPGLSGYAQIYQEQSKVPKFELIQKLQRKACIRYILSKA